MIYNDSALRGLFERAMERARHAEEKYGKHESVEFACCRVSEEAGELVQAATSVTKGRDVDRGYRMEEESIDLLAMIIRLLREYPLGRLRKGPTR